ncbi:MAG: hypothetical protein LBK13_08115 [Spirochaetales bacterium]|jgi:hypothetical protein|nr:hypothetical protein [Spirochaetales bacterium]
MILEKDECIALYIFLKTREGELPSVLEKLMERCKECAYDHLSALELEKLLKEAGVSGCGE